MPKHKKKRSIGKIILRTILILFLVFVSLILFIRSPWGQQIIVNKATAFLSEKTNTTISINKLYLTFSGNIFLEGFYVEDLHNDTLIYSKELEASVSILPLINETEFRLNALKWNGLKAQIVRDSASNAFNFDFIADAFNSSEETSDNQIADTSASLPISIGHIALSNFDLSFNDQVIGIKSQAKFDQLGLFVEELDLEKLHFHIDELMFTNADLNYFQTKAFKETTPSEDTLLPTLKIDELNLKNVTAKYASQPDSIDTKVSIGQLLLESGLIDLNKQELDLKVLSLDNSSSTVVLSSMEKTNTIDKDSATNEFNWPQWSINLEEVSLKNNQFNLRDNTEETNPDSFNPSLLQLHEFNLKANELYYQPESIHAIITQLSLKEEDDFSLQNLSLKAELSSREIRVEDFFIQTPYNQLNGNMSLNYVSIEKFLQQPENASFNFAIPNLSLHPEDLYYFLPELRKNPYLQKIAQKNLNGRINAKGSLAQLTISGINLKWGESTELIVKGSVQNITDINQLRFDLPNFSVTSSKTDLTQFTSDEELGIRIPENITISGKASGETEDMKGQVNLTIPEGSVMANGRFKNKDLVTFDGSIQVKELQLGTLLENEQMGKLTMHAKANGSGKDIQSINGSVKATVSTFQFNHYDYTDFNIDGTINNGKGTLAGKYKDYNLNMELSSGFTIDSLSPSAHLELDVIGADLNALGLSQKLVKTSFKVNADYKGNDQNFSLESEIKNGLIVYEQEPYPLGDFRLSASSKADSTSYNVSSDFLTLWLEADAPQEQLIKSLDQQFQLYFSDSLDTTISDSINMDLSFVLKETPIINDIFVQGLNYDSIYFKSSFRNSTKKIEAQLIAPQLEYNETTLDSIQFSLNGGKEELAFSFSFANLESGVILIDHTSINGDIKNEKAVFDFEISDENEKILFLKSELSIVDSGIFYHVNPEQFILNRNNWEIPSDNQILLTENKLIAQEFEISRNSQTIKLESSEIDQKEARIAVLFNNFKLSTLTSFLNPEEELATGVIQGGFTLINPFSELGFNSDVKIHDLTVLKASLGELNLNAYSESNNTYNMEMEMHGSDIDLSLNGQYKTNENSGELDFQLNLNRLNVSSVEPFFKDVASEMKGSIAVNANLTGTVEQPRYEGKIGFKETAFNIDALNARFHLPEESIDFDTDKVTFSDFVFLDADNNSFNLDGNVLTKNLQNPLFDLSLKAKQFQLLNSTAEDNELFFGEVNLNVDLTVKGDLAIPVIRGKLAVNSNSDFTYVIPEEELDLVEREGVVIFVNKENPDAIITRNEEETSSTIIKGYDLRTQLTIDRNVDFSIIVDPRAGDNLKVTGEGDFRLGLDPNGRTTLYGKYEVNDGYYEASLYNIVKRKFDIAKGSSITWSGNPLDADMDIRAIYRVETSASGLMASRLSGQRVGIANEFRQKLPFLVYLNLDGELLTPEISFQLDMPESSQGELGGQVYSQVQQLNTQEEELNKQVFSLLVLNQFFPSTNNDGTSGGSASIARGNVNKVLEDQLNNFSGKYLEKTGVELDFGVDSYTDYQGNSSQNRTQLDVNARKRLFNDKLIVSVGSGVNIEESSGNNSQNTPVVGNVSLEYLVTENGRWRLKGFRKNEFESVIEGQLIVTGISLIFQREFNRFGELLEDIKKEKNRQEKNQGM